MNRILISVVVFIAVCLTAGAVTANEAMARVASVISNAPGLQAAFVAKASDGTEAVGQLLMAREKFAMVTKDFGIWYNGADLCSYYENSREANITNPTEDELMETNPFDIINHYQSRFKASMLSKKDQTCTVRLTALQASSSIKTAVLTIDTKAWLPVRIEAVFANGSSVVVDVAGISALKAAPEASYFEFPKASYPGAEIIDLR